MSTFFSILFLISSLAIIISVLLQESKSEGLGVMSGGGTNLFGKSANRSKEAILARMTIISSIVFLVSAIVLAAI